MKENLGRSVEQRLTVCRRPLQDSRGKVQLIHVQVFVAEGKHGDVSKSMRRTRNNKEESGNKEESYVCRDSMNQSSKMSSNSSMFP